MYLPRNLLIVTVALLALTTAHGRDGTPQKQKDPPPVPEAAVMQVKLKRAHALLEALTLENYKILEENAESLVRISDSTAFLRAYKTPEYEFQAQIFRKTAATLAAKAKAKNLDGATLAYTEMTLSCVNCHNYFRNKKWD